MNAQVPSLETWQVAEFLRGHLGSDVREVAPIGQGDWSQAFSFSRCDGRFVARFGAHVEDFEKDRLASRFAAPGLPVPQVLEIGQALDRHFCVSERADGVHLDGLDAEEIRALIPAILQMWDALRKTDLSGTTGFGGWNGEGNAPHATWQDYLLAVDAETERVGGWHAILDEFPAERAAFDAGLDYLQRNLDSCPNERHLIHNDLLHFNALVKDSRISAVVDWGCSLYGDFLYDLAMFTFYAPWYPAMANIDWASEAKKFFEELGVVVSHFDERLRVCEAHLALGNMAYSAFTHRPSDLASNARRLTERIG